MPHRSKPPRPDTSSPRPSLLLALAAVLALLALGALAQALPPPPQVVILNSYHQGEDWSDNELAGIMPALRQAHPDLVPAVETLDAKRLPGPDNRDFLVRYLADKYKGRSVDLVMVLDNPALNLLLAHRQELFPGAPVVFAGINGFRPSLIQGQPDITGVAEVQDMAGTILIGLALRPQTRRILAIHDHTSSGLAVRRDLENALPQFEGRLEFEFTPAEPAAELEARLRALPPDSLAMILSYVTDSQGRIFTRAESTRLIAKASPVPVLTMHETRLGYGVVGGSLLGGEEHGRLAAGMALRVLAGEKASSIPVDVSGGSRPMFDHEVLQRFGIPESSLPQGSLVVNKPVSFYGQNRLLVNIALAVAALLLMLIALLAAALLRVKRTEAAVRVSEERFRSVFEQAAIGICHASLEGRFIRANQKFSDFLGYTQEELKGMSFQDVTLPEDLEKEMGSVRQLLDGRIDQYTMEKRYRRKDGRVVIGNLTVSVVRGPSGLPVNSVGIVEDITERRLMEQELAERELNYRTIFEAANDSIIIHDIATGDVIDANLKAVASYGYESLEELKGNDFWTDPPYSLVEAKAWMQKASEEGPQVFEWLNRRRDGQLFWEEVNLQKATLNGRDCLISVSRDITTRKQDQGELQRSEQRYRGLFNSVSDLVYSQDLQGRFLAVNAAVKDILGHEPRELLGRKASDFMKPVFAQAFEDQYLDRVITQGSISGVSSYFHKDGGHRFLEYRSQLFRPPEGEPFISGVARDVTERMNQQRRLKQLEDQLRHAQKMEAVGTLAGGIAHDFNNILGAVLGYGELALDSAESGKAPAEEIRQIISAADRARNLVRQLLTFSRKLEAEPKPVDLNREVISAVEMLTHTIPKMIHIETRLDPALWRISADSNQIEQVVLNLANNAVDAMPEGGSFTLATSNLEISRDGLPQHRQLPAGRYVLLTASDTGQGMDQATQAQIFDPFFTTKEVGKGTGLGLATIYGIVKGHQGHIFCTSWPGQGTSFKIYLPALEEDAPEGGGKPQATEGATGGAESILVVDDEEALREMSMRTLTAAGYRVATAASGEDALTAIESASPAPDLVLLDLGMPGMGGLKCLERIMALGIPTKVVIASGYAADGQARAALEAGASGFVAKPFHRLDLLRTVRKALDA